ncbi:cytochrome P450 [Didymella exigua CBS 183.55]|uniref:Cytochrome P450 n=1 Tax=Didymella exigua CBS 183.55 TaxID=1150837 RepID=A0A6A5RU02_9PLEO|nr:cytochrome P450 [Didymella exigua CBS 183.55]KAF1931945.1 cytochrome P450 [Didymella exigua CBS 183.55]
MFLALGLVSALFLLTRAVYRLWFSPLAHIPGPKIAALTSWYCAYHDLVRGGQYVWVVEDLHRRYGPIVRIRPDVLHVNDPSFLDTLYPQSPNVRRERAQTVLNLFHEHLSVLPTRDHHLHRQRRAVLSRFFSQQNVRRLVPVINDTLAKLLDRMHGWARDGEPVSLNAAYRAATKDIIQAYALGDGERCLDLPDCNAAFFKTLHAERLTHVSAHFHWFPALMARLPVSVITALTPHISVFIQFIEHLTTKIEHIRHTADDESSTTIFHEILRSDISAEEKSTPRLVDEAMVLAIAGADTTASTLAALTYHILASPPIFTRLRAELDSVMPSPDHAPDPKALDALPFLNALIEEALRLYPSATHRQDRLAPDQDLLFTYPDGRTLAIPAGTMVGMTAPLLNRHPAWHDDPDAFVPERHLPTPRRQWRNFAFSRGARQCLGVNLAYQELQTFTAGVFRRYAVYDERVEQRGPTLQLFRTGVEDVRLHADYVTPGLRPGSRGVRVVVRDRGGVPERDRGGVPERD